MLNEAEFMTELLAMWIESDVTARRAAVEAYFHEEVRFHDRNGGRVDGQVAA